VRIFSGADAALGVKTAILDDAPGPNGTKLFSESGSEWFGYSVAVLPDIDGDLWPEILVGAQQAAIASATECIPPHTDPPPRTGEGGYAALYTSGVGTLGGVTPGVRLATFYGEAFKDHMGRAVAADDLYGTSGRPEIVLSVPGWTPFGQTDPADVGHGCVWDGDAVLQ
jgi:hypothetical protein